MKIEEGWIESTEGNRLFWRRQSADGKPKAVLLFVHGLAEHSGRYSHVLEHFAGRGFDCWAPDLRGHGQSPGRRVHVNRFDDFLTDLRSVHHMILEACPEQPIFLIGHSQGGLITLRYALAYPEHLTAIVVSSPFLGLHPDSQPSRLMQNAARLLSVVVPRLMLSKPPDPSLLSRDPEVGKAYIADPLTSHSVSARWFTEVLAAHRDTFNRAGELKVDALVMQSGADRLADPAATRTWFNAAPSERVEYVEWHGFYHEMFNEIDREPVFDRIEEWLRIRLPSPDEEPG